MFFFFYFFMVAVVAIAVGNEISREKMGQTKSIISRKSGQKIQKIANLQYYKSKANYGTKKKGISR